MKYCLYSKLWDRTLAVEAFSLRGTNLFVGALYEKRHAGKTDEIFL